MSVHMVFMSTHNNANIVRLFLSQHPHVFDDLDLTTASELEAALNNDSVVSVVVANMAKLAANRDWDADDVVDELLNAVLGLDTEAQVRELDWFGTAYEDDDAWFERMETAA